jgi:hypothetical protein
MKTKLIYTSLMVAFLFALINCGTNGNTGNGSMDTGIKVGSGVSDSLDPEKGTYDTTTNSVAAIKKRSVKQKIRLLIGSKVCKAIAKFRKQ